MVAMVVFMVAMVVRSAGLKACYLESPAPDASWTETQIVALCAVLPVSSITEFSFQSLSLVSIVASYPALGCECKLSMTIM